MYVWWNSRTRESSSRFFFFFFFFFFFLLFLFHLFLFNNLWINVKRCFDVLLFIILTDRVSPWSIGICTYALFGIVKFTTNVAEWLRRWTLDQTFQGASLLTDVHFCSVPYIYFLITIFMCFPSYYFIKRVIDFIYIFYSRKSCTNLLE